MTNGVISPGDPHANSRLITEFPYGMDRAFPIVTHRFGEYAVRGQQRFQVGIGPRKFKFKKSVLQNADRNILTAFFEDMQGSYQSFIYHAPQADRLNTVPYTVIFDTQPLTISELVTWCQTGLTFVEIVDPTHAPNYSVSATCLRFPDSTLTAALLSDVQQIIPLVHVKVRDNTVPDIYLSDRRCTVGGHLYLPRLLNVGEEGSDVIMTQDISGAADNVSFMFGNADRIMTQLSNATDIKQATIDLSLYHVQSGRLLQLWKGYIFDFESNGSSEFTAQCSDGLRQVGQLYPQRTNSPQCWKTFNDGFNCPFTAKGHLINIGYSSAGVALNGQAGSCDFFLDSANGCQAHGMSPLPSKNSNPADAKNSTYTLAPAAGYFGGIPFGKLTANVKINNTGLWGFGRNIVTATSIASDTIRGYTLPEIWCNWDPLNRGADPDGVDRRALRAFIVNCQIAEVRDEGDFLQLLGIVGAGPIGRYAIDDPRLPPEGQSGNIVNTPDGYPVLVAPLADGFPPHGFSVDFSQPGQVSQKSKNNDLGLRQVRGADPVPPYDIGTNGLAGDPTSDPHAQMTAANGWDTAWQGTPWSTAFSLSNDSPPAQGADSSGFNPYYLLAGPIPYFLSGLWSGGGPNVGGASIYGPQVAAGTAFVSMRYRKSSSISPTTPDQHTMTVPVAMGLSGLIYHASAPTGTVDTITNPFWVAANCYFRAQGLVNMYDFGTRTAALATIVLDSFYKGDGTGAGEIADLQVAPLAGDPTQLETQFQFQGILATQKPFRDWLTEILACGLGFFSFEFGKLKVGMRENAGAVSAFTLGNMLLQSLVLTPVQANFERLIVEFADQSVQYQANTSEYYDRDHAAYMGRANAPLTNRQHVVGCPSISQAARLAATRVREETGGVNADEWKAARRALWKTTVLALETEVGQVVSISHTDVPNGDGNFRIKRWRLHKDWSITIEGQTVTDSMYNLDVGPKPVDVEPLPLPILFYPEPLGQWAPYQVQAPEADALFPREWNFDLTDSYQILADGTIAANVTATGNLPINRYIPNCGPPDIKSGNIVTSPFGGTLPDGVTLRVAVCASSTANQNNGQNISVWDTFFKFIMDTFSVIPPGPQFFNFVQFCIDHVSGTPHPTTQQQIDFLVRNDPGFAVGAFNAASKFSPPSDVVLIQIPPNGGANRSQFTLSGIQWPETKGLNGYVVFVSTEDDLICAVTAGGLTDNGTGNYSPTSVTILGGPRTNNLSVSPLPRSTWALPNSNVGMVKLKYKKVIHGGVLGASVFVATDNVITSKDLYDPSLADNWTGRVLMIIGRLNGSIPWLSFQITAYNPNVTDSNGNNVGVFTLNPDPGGVLGGGDPQFPSSGPPTGGDTFVVCFQGYDNSKNPYRIEDAGINNFVNRNQGAAGLIDNFEKGYIVRVIQGKGRGLRSKVVGNDQIGWDLDTPITIDTTSVWIVEEGAWQPHTETSLVQNSTLDAPSILTLPVANLQKQQILVTGTTIDHTGHEVSDADAPLRMAYVYGSGGLALDKPYTWNVWDSNSGARFLPVPVRSDSICVDFLFDILDSPGTAVTVDVQLFSALTGTTASIFANPVILPANSTGQVLGANTFAKNPQPMRRGDSLLFVLVTGDGSGTFTAVLQTALVNLAASSGSTGGSIVPAM